MTNANVVGDTDDPYHLSRFVRAQENNYPQVLAEIRSGRKRSHWMWYVFPQIDGLAISAISRQYAINSLDEARKYLDHPVLGPRLLECTEAVLGIDGKSATEIFGHPDDLKLRSCATLFSIMSKQGSIFDRLLQKFYGGARDGKTLRLLGREPDEPGESLIVSIAGIDTRRMLESWRWLIPESHRVIFVTKLGDLFLAAADGSVWWLDMGDGKLHSVAADDAEFHRATVDPDNRTLWFGAPLVDRLRVSGKVVERPGQCYSYLQSPVSGGKYEPANFRVEEVVRHFETWGPIYQRLLG